MRDALASSGECIGCRFAAGHSLTRRYNVRHMAWGRLFGARYKAVLAEGADSYHNRTLADYIHLNPGRARLLVPKKGQSVLDYPWSSVAGAWALPPGKRPKCLAAEQGIIRSPGGTRDWEVMTENRSTKLAPLRMKGSTTGYET
jgi:hypothetical protein